MSGPKLVVFVRAGRSMKAQRLRAWHFELETITDKRRGQRVLARRRLESQTRVRRLGRRIQQAPPSSTRVRILPHPTAPTHLSP